MDIIVVGASMGGVEALRILTAGLPETFPAAVLIVLHIPPTKRSFLPQVLAAESRLPVSHALETERIVAGRVYVAPPDSHLIVERGHLRLWHGPKENRLRPAINVLFRSAAVAYTSNVIGVILSGTLDDGSAGLWWVKKYGGIAIVQDPTDADYPEMPRNALQTVEADYQLPISDIATVLAKLVNGTSNRSAPEVGAR